MLRSSSALATPGPLCRRGASKRQGWHSVGTLAVCFVLFARNSARAYAPLNYLLPQGARAHSISILAWFMLGVSIAVIAVITALLLAGIWRARDSGPPALPGEAIVERPTGGAAWIYVGVGATTVILFVTTIWTMMTLADTSNFAPRPPALRLEVTGHQWWWGVRYTSSDPW